MGPPEPSLQRWKPGVSKTVLLLTAGVVWVGVGVMLNRWAYVWLQDSPGPALGWRVAIAFGAALGVHHWGFLRIVDRNLGRILPMQGRHCFFAFIPWKSYLLTALMIVIGVVLRYSQIPKQHLALLYMAIGTALILSSLRYLRYLYLGLRGISP